MKKKKIKLKPCPFCGWSTDLQVVNQGALLNSSCFYDCPKDNEQILPLRHTWFVGCPFCGANGPIFFPVEEKCYSVKSDAKCRKKAIKGWNKRNDKF